MTNQTTSQVTSATNVPQVHVVPVLTVNQLIEKLVELKAGNNFISLVARTIPKMRKTSNPFFDDCFKIASVNASIQFDYENAVNRQLVREGQTADFQAQAAKWGTRIGKSCVIEHNGQHYIYVKVEKSLGYEYQNANGDVLDKDKVNAFLPERKESAQGTDKEIIVRKYTLENVLAITLNGVRYIIR